MPTRLILLLLVTPAMDPSLQMDVDLLQDMRQEVQDLAAIAIVTQVDRLRPMREVEPALRLAVGRKTQGSFHSRSHPVPAGAAWGGVRSRSAPGYP